MVTEEEVRRIKEKAEGIRGLARRTNDLQAASNALLAEAIVDLAQEISYNTEQVRILGTRMALR